MTPEKVTEFFTRADGSYAFARWGRPLAPVAFGIDDATLSVLKGSLEAMAALAGQNIAETDPELGSNMMFFFFKEWSELRDVPKLDKLVPNLGPLTRKLEKNQANQYRFFRFDDAGGIKACFVFLRMDEHLSKVSAHTLCLSQSVQSILLWSDTAFLDASPLAILPDETTLLKPEIGALIRAAYDPALPSHSSDPSHGLRLFARMSVEKTD